MSYRNLKEITGDELAWALGLHHNLIHTHKEENSTTIVTFDDGVTSTYTINHYTWDVINCRNSYPIGLGYAGNYIVNLISMGYLSGELLSTATENNVIIDFDGGSSNIITHDALIDVFGAKNMDGKYMIKCGDYVLFISLKRGLCVLKTPKETTFTELENDSTQWEKLSISTMIQLSEYIEAN